MRTLALLALVAVFLSVSTSRHYTPGDYLEYAPSDGFGHARSNPNSASKPFQQKNTEYTFIYNAQIASGLQSEENVANPQQKAITRVQCLAKIQFASERHGQLQLQQCRAGQQNEQMSEPQEMQPIEAFEQTKLQLQQPCQFSYSDGVVERVQCQQDEDWSKNFKKAVLNMIQLNLKRNSAQKEPKQQSTEQYTWETKMGKTFTTPEITLEGECQTTYTINKARAEQQYSVTKTINFKKCQKIADVAKGFQTEQPQAQCAHCQQYWAQQQDEQNLHANAAQQQQQNEEQHPCAKCDPKEVKENELDRSTVIRCRIQGEPTEQYALNGCELRSQYVYRNSKSADGNYGAAMQTVVTATLQALDVQLKQQQIPAISANDEETLLYSNGKDVDEKRFYRNGDENFGTNGKDSPFARVPKVQQAVQALNKLVQNMQDKQKGIDQQAPIQQQRLVEMLRMCTQQELKQVEQQCPGTTAQQREQCKQIVVIALAQCGTMNCVAELAKRIKNKQVPKAVVVQALLSLNQLPAPSDGILDEMEQLCKSEAVNSQPMPKQSCWLTFGALVNEVCQHKTEKNAQECVGSSANCVQSGFYEKDQCPTEKKQKYKEAMLAVYQNHGCIFDKAVALGALGNAGLHNALNDLEKILKNPQEPRVVRVMAIDATRRLGVEMPRKVRNVLLPVFLNTREQPQLRIAAFANLLNAQTEPQVVDQLMFAIAREPNKEVQSYAYRTMKTLAKSQNPNEKRIAKHIKSALKMANVDEQQLRYSGKWQFSLYNAKEREGAFISLARAVSSRSALPAYAHAQLDSHFNDQYQLSNVKQQQQQTRAQRQNLQYSTKLRSIYEDLGIKNRRSLFYDNEMDGSTKIGTYQQQNIKPFVMLCLRSNNVDKAFLALDENIMEEQTRKMLNGQEKANWALLFGQGQQLNTAILQNLNEKEAKIPTSAGVPLRILNSMPILANIEGQLKIKTESARLTSPLGFQLDINAKASARMAQIQKMELWTPFAASGVECVRSVQVNLPLQGELNANWDQGISLKAKLPQQKTQLANAHSLPITYIAKVDSNTNLVREPRQILTIHDPKLERQQHEVNAVQGQKNWAMPLHIQGHYHWPTEPTSYQQFAQLLLATEKCGASALPTRPEQSARGHLAHYRRAFPKRRHRTSSRARSCGISSRKNSSARTVATSNSASRTAIVSSAANLSSCDEQMNYCKVQVQAEPHVLMPETAASVEQLQRKPQQFKQFIAQAKAQWGQQGQSQQHVNVRMLGTQAHTQHVRAALQQRQDKRLISVQQQRNFQRRSAFLNKLQIEAAYSLKAYAQNAINRVLEVFKSTYFWNTKSQLLSGQNAQKNGKVAAIIVIDSMTQKNANVTIQTPAQKVRMQQIELPYKVRPFSLIRQQSAQQIDSIAQLFHHFNIKNRPQCTVDGRSVDTFDDFIYTAPLSSNCHSVLAKDCGSEEPQFVVLMKKVPQQQNNNNNKKSAPNAEKMLVVITPKQQIECQPKTNAKGPQQRRLICKVNGQQIAGDEQCQGKSCVQFNDPQQNDVTIRTEDIAVRFNGRKAWLKVSRAFKNTQCGLCGHYDDSDDQEEELRMANGKFASNLAEFHRSYALKDSELCSQQALDNFYSEQNGEQDSFLEQYNQLDNDSEQNNEAEGEGLESDWQKEQFDGKLDSSEKHEEEDIDNNLSDNISEPNGPSQPPPAPKCCCCCQEEGDEQCQQKCHTSKQCDVVCKSGRCAAEQPIWKATWPTWKTKVQEQNHAVCFSTQPVKQCPSGAYSYSSMSSDYGSDEEEDSNNDEQQNEQKSKKVSFVCMERSDQETRRLLRLLRQGQRVVNVSGHGASFTETVNEPQQCWHSRF
uniref:Vitellogenin n=1 Tax=Globodera pallida TaxID=36090 RepID=A0A183C2D0_GLOPA